VIRLHHLLAQIKREKSKLDIVFATCRGCEVCPSCTRAAEPIITVPLRFLFPALSQFLKEPQQDQPFLF
jgi:hypothetical protein